MLANQLDNVVALVEPMDVSALFEVDAGEAARRVRAFARAQRQQIRARGTAIARFQPGGHDDNTFSEMPGADGLRNTIAEPHEVRIPKPLDRRFTLMIKHPNAFTAILHELRRCMPCYAMIRHPVSVLGSWSTLAIPLREGHAPAAENIDRQLAAVLDREPDRLRRQARLLSWYFERYQALLPEKRLVRYEDLTQAPATVLHHMFPHARQRRFHALESRNRSGLYDSQMRTEIIQTLRTVGGAWEAHYPDLEG